ncbi:hypothetical protein HOC01_05265 [archaeon]|nr:hypothetical protein [archaeon]MBT6698220.1 hypothetical protein [archaeon]
MVEIHICKSSQDLPEYLIARQMQRRPKLKVVQKSTSYGQDWLVLALMFQLIIISIAASFVGYFILFR